LSRVKIPVLLDNEERIKEIAIDWEKIFTQCLPNKGLATRIWSSKLNQKKSPGTETHTCNPSFSGSRELKDCGFRSAQAKS
jgi:hypothetical protein